jgi:hypothetical protein
MAHFLTLVRRRHGTMDGLAGDIGVDGETVEAMRRNLLVPDERAAGEGGADERDRAERRSGGGT